MKFSIVVCGLLLLCAVAFASSDMEGVRARMREEKAKARRDHDEHPKLSREELTALIGKTVVKSDDARRGDDVVVPTSLASKVRVIHPGQMVTKDFHPNRLNLDVDEDNKIKNAHYG